MHQVNLTLLTTVVSGVSRIVLKRGQKQDLGGGGGGERTNSHVSYQSQREPLVGLCTAVVL